MKFTENQAETKKGQGKLLTENQQKWVEMQRMIIAKKPLVTIPPPKNKFRNWAYRVTREWGDGMYFDFIVLIFILANIATMAMTYEGTSDAFDNNLTNINYMFTAVFIAEALFKILGIGFRYYFRDGWNKFDMFVIASSVIDILVSLVGTSFSFLRIGPQLIRVVRVLRVTRLFKLVRQLKGIQKILLVLYLSLPAILNLIALLFLVYFIFSVLAVFLFQNITKGIDIDNNYVNFSNFGIAMLTLFKCSTGENWYRIMYDTVNPILCSDGTQSCGQCNPNILIFHTEFFFTAIAPLFWIMFILVVQNLMINMLLAVMIQEFESKYFSDGDVLSLDKFKENVSDFDKWWAKLHKKGDGKKIKSTKLIALFSKLQKPLGKLNPNLHSSN